MKVKKGQIWILPRNSKFLIDRSWDTHRRRVVRILRGSQPNGWGVQFEGVGGGGRVPSSEAAINEDFEFLAWERERLPTLPPSGAACCPWCLKRLSPTLHDNLMLCTPCNEKFRFVTWEAAKDWFKDLRL